MTSSACPHREELTEYVLGKLSLERSEEIDMHLQICTECQGVLETCGDVGDTFVSRLQHEPAKEKFVDEPECQELMARVAAIGREPSFMTRQAMGLPSSAQPDLGSIGAYRFLAKLGEGGMGTVYKALHTRLKRVVALKVLPAERMEDPQAIARFDREMEAVGKLDHPNIVRASDADEEDGLHYLVMEYVDGVDLSELVHHDRPLAIPDACEIIRQAAEGLQDAHEHGLVHRDIKPSNLMLTTDGQVKILDLGLALLEPQPGDQARDLTTTGQTMGTLDYMAPEQGDDSHQVDIRADIYSLGATLYKLLSGRAPFAGDKHQTPVAKLMALATVDPEPLNSSRNDLPADLVAFVHCMLSKSPDDRPATPAEVAEALAQWCPGCDLAALATGAAGLATHTETERRPRSTSPHLSSSATDTTSDGTLELGDSALVSASDAGAALESPIAEPKTSGFRIGWRALAVVVGAGLAAIVLLAVLLTIMTPYGKVIVESEDENVQVAVMQDGKDVQIIGADSNWTVRLREGKYEIELRGGDDRLQVDKDTVEVTRRGKVVVKVELRRSGIAGGTKPPPLAIAPFDAAQAKKHQQAWAEYLGLPVERDFELPGGEKLTMVLIPPGEFMMGSNAEEQARFLEDAKANNDTWAIHRIPNEGPQHRVRITRPFYLGKYEVTQAQWEAVMGSNPSNFKDNPAHPVEQVSWDDIQPFLGKLNAAGTLRLPSGKSTLAGERLEFALPTESQWEYACRAGTTTPWHHGDTEESLREGGWFNANSGGKTHLVGQLKASAWGLYDMHGNVWEWCVDWYGAGYYRQSPMNNPSGPMGSSRVRRGGSWRDRARLSRLAIRHYGSPADRDNGLGLRLALVLPETMRATPPEEGTPASTPDDDQWTDWESLFDGVSLKGWEARSRKEKSYVDDGRIVLPRDANLTWTGEFPTSNYEVAVTAMHTAENRGDFTSLRFPMGDQACQLVIGGISGSEGVFLNEVRGDPDPSHLRGRPFRFTPNQWYRYRLRVTDGRLEAWIEDQKAIDLPTEGLRFKAVLGSPPFSVYTYGTTGAVRTVHLRRLKPSSDTAGLPSTAGEKPPLAIAPFDADKAKKHQQEWADYLGLPVEKDFDLPGGEKLTMVLIPPGEFMMGSSEEEQAHFLEEATTAGYDEDAARIPSEGPQHPVRLTRPFYLGKYEVTQAQWEAVMGSNASKFKGRKNPVEMISRDEIQTLLAKLNQPPLQEGTNVTLPTEAQWEYACRAGTTTCRYGGDGDETLREYAWFSRNSGKTTQPVGQLRPNGFGLYDMLGNVRESCADWYDPDYYAQSPPSDPLGPLVGECRVDRGGCQGQRIAG